MKVPLVKAATLATLASLAAAVIVGNLGCGDRTPAEEKIERGDGPSEAIEVGVSSATAKPKACSDYASVQEVLADEMDGKLSRADKKNLDQDGDGILCNEKGIRWKDNRTHVVGLPPFEVAFVVDRDIPDLKTCEITVDVSRTNDKPVQKLSEWTLTTIANGAIHQVGVVTEPRYRAASITFRDAKTYEEIDALGFYVSDPETAVAINEYLREEEGWKIDFYDADKVPEGGDVAVIKY